MEKRVLIIDFNHLAHIYMNSQYRLSVKVSEMGSKIPRYVLRHETNGGEIDTTVQNSVVKNIYKWSNKGTNPTVVCFDSPVPARKAYFAKAFNMQVDTESEYKGGRTRMSDLMYNALGMSFDILSDAGIATVKADNYEADDLVFAAILKAKEIYPGMPIDVVTNDADLLPLVDNTVSIFLRSKKMTYAINDDLTKLHYVQVTPSNYQEVIESLSRYKGFYIPYNTVLLHKLLRGDPADNLPGISKLFPPRKYNKLMEDMIEDWVAIHEVFRYGVCKSYYVNKNTHEREDNLDIIRSNPTNYIRSYENPKELDRLIDVMKRYVDDEKVLDHISKMYLGMNLNQVYVFGNGNIRKPARLKSFAGFDEFKLQSVVTPLKIRLNLKE